MGAEYTLCLFEMPEVGLHFQVQVGTVTDMNTEEAFNRLDLDVTASLQDVEDAHKELSRVWHPDKNPPNLYERCTNKQKDLNEARYVLRIHFEGGGENASQNQPSARSSHYPSSGNVDAKPHGPTKIFLTSEISLLLQSLLSRAYSAS